MIQSCQCNCCTTRNRMSTTDIIFKLDGVAAYNKEEPSGGDLERLHQHNLKLQSELDRANNENTKLYAAHTELSRVDKRNFGELIIENVRLREENQALVAQVAEQKNKLEHFSQQASVHEERIAGIEKLIIYINDRIESL